MGRFAGVLEAPKIFGRILGSVDTFAGVLEASMLLAGVLRTSKPFGGIVIGGCEFIR